MRARLTVVSAVAVALLLGVTSVGLVGIQQRQLLRGIDDVLAQRAQDLLALLASDNLPSVLADIDLDDSVAQLVTADGLVIAASQRANTVEPIVPDVSRAQAVTADTPVDDEPFRVVSRPTIVAGEAAVLHVATAVESLDQSRSALIGALAIGIPLTVAALAALVWWLVGRALSPVAAIQAEVAAITGQHVGRRVPDPGTDDEIGRLARLVNEMLGRLEAASARQRRFVADAAHELRSPLTRMRSELEVDQAHPQTADVGRTAASVLEETVRMQQLVADLLLLARYDESAVPLRPADVEVRSLAAALISTYTGTVAVTLMGAPATVHADARMVRRALSNLLTNALRFARAAVVVEIQLTPEFVEVSVADDGPGIPVEAHHRIFERFARLDDARGETDGGAGLGLSIAREVASAHGGTLEVDPASGPGARLVMRLPVSAPAIVT